MEKIKLRVFGNQIEVVERPAVITAGTVGMAVEFAFDSQWDNLTKMAVFKAGDKVVATAMEKNIHTVPWEVLEKPNQWLCVGVYGANREGTVVIPTLWAKVSVIHTGVDPKGDPALDPTATVWQDLLSQMEDIHTHIYNSEGDNPHGVTCAQIDAVHVDEVADRVEAVLEGNGVNDHLRDKDNPHGVTAEQVGAAPAGYGLGEKVAPAIAWKFAGSNGFSRSSNDSPDGKLWWGITSVRDYSGGYNVGTHIAFTNENDILTQAMRVYKASGVTATGAWEYVNPPMLEGVEYRTTERFMGKAVYTQLIDLRKHMNFSAPDYIDEDAKMVQISLDIIAEKIVDATNRQEDGMFVSIGNSAKVPWDVNIGVDGWVCVNFYNLKADDLSGAILTLKYTKVT